MRTAASLPSGVTCGVVGDTIEVATPPLSISSSVFCTDQCTSGGLLRPIRFIASSQLGGTTVGATVMETAMNIDVPGILATCGGSCSCATCHVYVREDWFEKLGALSLEELDMLDTAHDLEPTSRLSCQILVTEELDGLTV